MKADPIRWTLGLAATEYGMDRRTLATRAKTSGQVPGEDGKFSTRQIAAIIFGDAAGEKLRKLRAEADLAEIERDTLTKNCISMEVLGPIIDRQVGGARQIILNSSMTEQEKEETLTMLAAVSSEVEAQDYKLPKAEEPPPAKAAQK